MISDSKNILLTGSNGKLGSAIIGSKLYNNLLNPSKDVLDITKPRSIDNYLYENDIDFVIHSAALARMSLCQEKPQEAIKTNIIGTSNLVRSIMKFEEEEKKIIRFIHISTDGVYICETGNYSEQGVTIPYNNYGWSKLGAECAVRLLTNYIIIRTRFFNPDNIPFENSATDIYTSSITLNKLVESIYFIMNTTFIGTINIGDVKKSEYNRYKKYKPSLKPCKRTDIAKKLNFEIGKDASMNCELWDKLKDG